MPAWAWFALGWFIVALVIGVIIGRGARLPYCDPDPEWPP